LITKLWFYNNPNNFSLIQCHRDESQNVDEKKAGKDAQLLYEVISTNNRT